MIMSEMYYVHLVANQVLAIVTSLVFTVHAALNPSYSATTSIFASTLTTCAAVW